MRYKLLLFAFPFFLTSCVKETILVEPDPNLGPNPNCQEQNTIFGPDNQPAKITSNLTFAGEVYDFQMLTPDTGYIFGASPVNNTAVLLKTNNGGQTFGPSNLQVPYLPLGCRFKDVNTGIVTLMNVEGCPNCINIPTFAITRDGGASWASSTIPGMKGDLYHPQFDEQGNMYAILHNNASIVLLVSKDSGENWDTLYTSPELFFIYQDFAYSIEGDKIFVLGVGGKLFVIDKQGNLEQTISLPESFLTNLHILDAQNMLQTSYSGSYQTTDGGNTWVQLRGNQPLVIAFESPQKGLVAQSKGQCGSDIIFSQDALALTTDGGQTYQEAQTPASNLRYIFKGAQRIGPGKFLALFGRQLVELNIPQ